MFTTDGSSVRARQDGDHRGDGLGLDHAVHGPRATSSSRRTPTARRGRFIGTVTPRRGGGARRCSLNYTAARPAACRRCACSSASTARPRPARPASFNDRDDLVFAVTCDAGHHRVLRTTSRPRPGLDRQPERRPTPRPPASGSGAIPSRRPTRRRQAARHHDQRRQRPGDGPPGRRTAAGEQRRRRRRHHASSRPRITLPADGNLTLSFQYYLAHSAERSSTRRLLPGVRGRARPRRRCSSRWARPPPETAAWTAGQREPQRVRRPDRPHPHRSRRREHRQPRREAGVDDVVGDAAVGPFRGSHAVIRSPRASRLPGSHPARTRGGACSRGERPAPAQAVAPSILLVTIDTLRADRVGAYGDAQARDASPRRAGPLRSRVRPRLLAGAADASSHTTILTGLLPPAHGVRGNGGPCARRPGPPTLAGRSRARPAHRGVRRRLPAEPAPRPRPRVRALRRPHGESARAALRIRRAASVRVVSAARTWLAAATGPVFVWVHLFDPHAPYDPPPRVRRADPYRWRGSRRRTPPWAA